MSATTVPTTRPQKRASATTLRLVRKIHLYFGLFISPALLFFAFTGMVQTLSLHEAAGNSFKPPSVLVELGMLHKHQTLGMPVRKAPENKAAKPGHAAAPDDEPDAGVTLAGKQKQHLPMKIFFLAVSLGLLTSTVTGVYMSYKYARSKVVVTGTLAAGVLVPLVLLKF